MKYLNFKKGIILVLAIISFNAYATETLIKLTDQETEQIGIDHNKYLEAYMRLVLEKKSAITDRNSVINIIKENNITRLKLDENPKQFNKESLNYNIKEIENAEEILSQILSSSKSINEINEKIQVEVEKVKNNTTLTTIDYNNLMSFYCIARYSADFWFSKELGGSGLGISLNNEISELIPTLFQKIESEEDFGKVNRIVAADAIGGALGGIQWCGATIWTGTGALAGFVGGVVWGAARSSFMTWAVSHYGVNMEPYCLNKEEFDMNRLKDIKNNDEYYSVMNDYWLDLTCCYITRYKASYCKKYMDFGKN